MAIRAGAIPPWCTATQQRVKLESVDFSTERVKRRTGELLGRWRGNTYSIRKP